MKMVVFCWGIRLGLFGVFDGLFMVVLSRSLECLCGFASWCSCFFWFCSRYH